MAKLHLEPRIQNPDPLYKTLAYLHSDLSAEESLVVNAKLLFLLINHIGDEAVVYEAIDLVRKDMDSSRVE